MKFPVAAAFVFLAIVATLLGGVRAGSTMWGRMSRTDQLVQKRQIVRTPKHSHMQIYEFRFPQYNLPYGPLIKAVKAIDHDHKSGASALLTQGGPGYRNVTVHLISQPNRGLDFTIEVWSTKR